MTIVLHLIVSFGNIYAKLDRANTDIGQLHSFLRGAQTTVYCAFLDGWPLMFPYFCFQPYFQGKYVWKFLCTIWTKKKRYKWTRTITRNGIAELKGKHVSYLSGNHLRFQDINIFRYKYAPVSMIPKNLWTSCTFHDSLVSSMSVNTC